MHEIAEATGGRVYLNTNAIGNAIRHAIDDSTLSYVLGYYSSRPTATTSSATSASRSTAAASSFAIARAICRRRSSSRNANARLDALGRVMQSPIEASSISAERGARAGRQGRHPRRCARSRSVTWEQKKDVREAAIDVVITQSIPDGKYFTIKETTVNLTADPERYQQMIEDGLTLSSNFTAVPNAYRLHVVISDVASQSVGSLIIPIKK